MLRTPRALLVQSTNTIKTISVQRTITKIEQPWATFESVFDSFGDASRGANVDDPDEKSEQPWSATIMTK